MLFARATLFPILTMLSIAFTSCQHSATNPAEPVPADSTTLFKEVLREPVECSGCHPNHYAQWQMSMHAYAFSDPVFIALNETGQYRSSNQLDQFCTKCHAPLGPELNETPVGFDPDAVSPLVTHGVHCDVCHTIADFSGGEGVPQYHLDGIRRGSIEDPVENSVHASEFDQRFGLSTMCQPCHDVLAPDKSMLIERTSTEWDESPYSAMGLECQDCHMPATSGEAAVGGPVRDVHDHRMVGVDYPLIDFPGKEETIAGVAKLLQNAVTLKVEYPATVQAGESFPLVIKVQNDKTGHSVPSGNTIDRQMWLEVRVSRQSTGEVLFATGMLDENGDLMNHDSELVAEGNISEDRNLVLFNSTAFDANDRETDFFWEARRLEQNTIPAFQTHTSEFTIPAPDSSGGMRIDVRLRFRSFPPYLLRELGLAYLQSELLVFDMASESRTVDVSN